MTAEALSRAGLRLVSLCLGGVGIAALIASFAVPFSGAHAFVMILTAAVIAHELDARPR